MGLVDEIQRKVGRRRYELSRHAVDQSIVRDITIADFEEAVKNRCELVEDYPDDKYGPSCLLLCFTRTGRPLHVQCSHPSRDLVKVVTLYEPDPKDWLDFRRRRTREGGERTHERNNG